MSNRIPETSAGAGTWTVTECLKRIRQNIAKRLRDELGLVVGNQDVIANDRRHGYWPKEWIVVCCVADEAKRPQPSGRGVMPGRDPT